MRISDSESHARFRYSVRPTRRSAEASRLLSCGCAHYRVQPDTARQLTVTLPPRGVAPRTIAPRGHRIPLLATLMEFPIPSTLEPRRIHSTPVCLTGYVPPAGFLTLSTVFSSPERPALFHAGNAHGISLSRGFPSLPGPATHRLGITLLTFLHRTNESSIRGVRAPRAETRLSDLFRLQGFAPTVNPYHLRDCYVRGDGRSPPELRMPLQGFALRSQATSRAT